MLNSTKLIVFSLIEFFNIIYLIILSYICIYIYYKVVFILVISFIYLKIIKRLLNKFDFFLSLKQDWLKQSFKSCYLDRIVYRRILQLIVRY